MTFKIIVCIKQVPDTDDIRWTENNTIQREGLDSIINPYDISALQFANNYKYVLDDVQIIVVSMGPMQTIDALKEAIAIGADEAYLLSDKRFSGADTLATAYTISKFVKTFYPDFNLILCGQHAIDGDTAQTPTSLAEKLGIPQLTNVIWIKEITPLSTTLIRDTETTRDEIKIKHPALIAIANNDLEVTPKINGYINSIQKQIVVLNAEDIGAQVDKIGLKGSPTQVKKAYRPIIVRNNKKTDTLKETSSKIILDEINKCRLL